MMKKVLIFLSACFIMLSCANENTSYIAQITIKTTAGIPIPNASVKLTVPVDGSNSFYGLTDENRMISYELKAKAYYDVKTWKGTWRGCGYVEFKKGETVAQTVFIRPYGDPLNTCFN